MNVSEVIAFAKSKIHSDFATMLLADLLNVNSLELLLMLDKEVPNDILETYKYRINELSLGKPIQYVIGNVNFYGNQFIVNNNVLIPRFETEQLVEKVINKTKELWGNELVNVIDLGCGSGVIGLTIKKKLPSINVTLLDISEEALNVAKENAHLLEIDADFVKNDMLNNINNKYDVVVSNPPYIKTDEEIEEIVKNNEPHLALYGGDSGLDYYQQILSSVKNNLKEKYLIAFEIGDTQKEDLFNLASEYLDNYNIECFKDYCNRDRIITITNKSE